LAITAVGAVLGSFVAAHAKIRAMTASWGTVLTELIPLALVIALSPLSIIPAVLVLHTPRAKVASLLYLVGWVLALAVLTAIFVEVSGLTGNLSSPPKWASYLRIVVGVALIVFGIIRWVNRNKSPHMPKWMTQLSNVTPVKAGITGAALAVINPKVLFICAAAGLAIGTAGIGAPAAWLAVAYFVAIAASTVALPVLAYAVSGDRLQEPLNRLKVFMEKHNAALVAAILIVIGLLVLYKGIHAL
jgi:threonine/homoserine/homoserine lactone efflux protein